MKISTKDLEVLPQDIQADSEVTEDDMKRLAGAGEKLFARMFNDIEFVFSKMKEKHDKAVITKMQEEGKGSLNVPQTAERKLTDTDSKIKEIRFALNKLTKNNYELTLYNILKFE